MVTLQRRGHYAKLQLQIFMFLHRVQCNRGHVELFVFETFDKLEEQEEKLKNSNLKS